MSEKEIADLYKCIGANVREFRKFRKMKTKELADKLSISEGTIRNIESGSSVSVPLLMSIIKELDVPINAIIPDYNCTQRGKIADSAAMEIFVDTFSNCSQKEQDRLLKMIKLFREE